MSITVITGEEEYLMELASIEEANSMLCSSPIIIDVKDFKQSDGLLPIFSDNNEECYIITNCDKNTDLNKFNDGNFVLLYKCGVEVKKPDFVNRLIHIEKLKIVGDKNDVVKWILKEGERLNIDLSRVAGALFLNCGNRLRKLASEIGKLKTLTPNGSVVTPEVARSVLCFSAELTPKSIIDALTQGKTSACMSIYDRLQESGDETGWILSFLYSFVLQILRVKHMNSAGIKNIHDSLSVSPFIVNNFIHPHIDKWTFASLQKSVVTLSEIDVRHKSGDIISDFLLESEIVRLSEEAKTSINKSKSS